MGASGIASIVDKYAGREEEPLRKLGHKYAEDLGAFVPFVLQGRYPVPSTLHFRAFSPRLYGGSKCSMDLDTTSQKRCTP